MLKVNIINYLKKNIQTDKLKHAYLFEGSESLDRREIVQWFVKKLQCERNIANPCNVCRSCHDIEKNQHPDVLTIDGKVDIKELRKLKQHLTLSSFNSNYKIVVINSADKISLEAMSTLLKTLEEPRGKALLILTTNRLSLLPQTILSRCEKISITPPSLTKTAYNLTKKEYNDILQKPLIDIFEYLKKTAKNKPLAISILNSWLFLFRKKAIEGDYESQSLEELIKTIKKINQIRGLLLNTNVDQRLALENLVLNFFLCIRKL